ncbi:MAG: flagellar basal body rod protein FlgB [Alphaproteobacteria bacterium]|nr:flagellar basal body rod protein FlgB [Alphaproteobacteria bacterium]
MDLNRTPLFQMITQRMGWLTERQRVIAQNVANADTPGYQARDLRPQDFSRALAQTRTRIVPTTTDGNHLSRSTSTSTSRPERIRAGETTLSGNSVQLEQEMMKAADSAVDYQLASNLYRRHLNLLRTVVGRGGSQ